MTMSLCDPTPMPDLHDVLERLKLATYLDALATRGFHDWGTVLDISEEDFTALGFKLGHRRLLQREIATWRGVPYLSALEMNSNLSEEASLSTSVSESVVTKTSSSQPREKRAYRRHPRRDSNAPKKPKTAYVNFADELRATPEIRSLSFVDIAKEVGRRWQELSVEKKRLWENQAARAMQEFEEQMCEYKNTQNWRIYQSYLAEFRSQHHPRVRGKRATLSREGSSNLRHDSCPSPSPSSESSMSFPSVSTSIEASLCHNALTLACSELVSLRGEILGPGVRPYDEQHLPPESLVRRAMYAFVQGTGSLLYILTIPQADEILDRVYRPQKRVDAMTLSECFVVAAMGAHYDMETFPDPIRRVLYASGAMLFDEKSATLDYMRGMRLLLSLAFYALLEKHLSSRYLIAAGLQIARWKCPLLVLVNAQNTGESWRRVYRSIIFVDCWLSYTLGYAPEVLPNDMKIACNMYQTHQATMDEQIHTQTSKIGLVAAEIARTVVSPASATHENMAMLSSKLETWRLEVPLMLQISILTSDNPPPLDLFQRRAILMVHVMYLGALILLYRQLLVATTDEQDLNLSVEEVQRYRSECTIAGQQMARILQLLSFDGTSTKRCWLLIYWSFTASIVLLSSATTKLLEGQLDGVEQELAYVRVCMQILERSRDFEPVATRYLNTIWPLYDHISNIHHRVVGRTKTSLLFLLQADSNAYTPPVPVSKAEIDQISEKLFALLTDPFGRKQTSQNDYSGRRLLNADGSCEKFWWR